MKYESAKETLKTLGLLDWKTLLLGWDRDWVTTADVANYAVERLVSNTDEENKDVVLLGGAELLDKDTIRSYLDNLAGNQSKNEMSLEKWRLVFLMELDAMEVDWNEKVARLERLVADFDYPNDMSLCTRYGPSQAAIELGFASPGDLKVDPLDEMKSVISHLKQRLGVI